jgi:hypothetical protein
MRLNFPEGDCGEFMKYKPKVLWSELERPVNKDWIFWLFLVSLFGLNPIFSYLVLFAAVNLRNRFSEKYETEEQTELSLKADAAQSKQAAKDEARKVKADAAQSKQAAKDEARKVKAEERKRKLREKNEALRVKAEKAIRERAVRAEAHKVKAEEARKERALQLERQRLAHKERGYKKPLFPNSFSLVLTLACGHQILTSESSGVTLLGKSVLCEVCNERRTVTNQLPEAHRNR